MSEGAGEAGGDVISVSLQGMAAGTLLYVVFFEVLARERGNKHSGICQLLAIVVGFLCMFGFQMICKYLCRTVILAAIRDTH